MTFAEASAVAIEIDRDLKADDPKLRGSVMIFHDDGSYFNLKNAFSMKYYEYWLVFTEHHGYFVHHQDDIFIDEFSAPVEETQVDSPA